MKEDGFEMAVIEQLAEVGWSYVPVAMQQGPWGQTPWKENRWGQPPEPLGPAPGSTAPNLR